MTAPLFQLENITKSFPGVTANDGVSLSLWEGTMHAIIGENGAGKSTLMGILYGKYHPDSGRILHKGVETPIRNPGAAIALGIGMVTQHTTMIPALTALENVILGDEPAGLAGVIDRNQAAEKVNAIANRLGVQLDWDAPAEQLSVAALQKAEIVKALFRGARILILDEPTATLAPQEADSLFALMRSLVEEQVTVIFVTHKLREVLAHSERVTVLRGGRVVGERMTADTYTEDLLSMMLGRTTSSAGMALSEGSATTMEPPAAWKRGPNSELLMPSASLLEPPDGSYLVDPEPALEIDRLSVFNDARVAAVRAANIQVLPGEVVGVAGIDGSGQLELAQAIVGLRRAASGRIIFGGRDITRLSVAERQSEGMAYIPEDRHREGLILDFTVAENLLLGKQREYGFGGGRTLSLARVAANAEAAIRDHRIRARGGGAAARELSGGNQQKVVVARALESRPRFLVAMQPTRGLDVEATRIIYSSLIRACSGGMAVILFSLDLDEIFELSTRIAVMFNGEIVAVVPRNEASAQEIGRLMVEGRA